MSNVTPLKNLPSFSRDDVRMWNWFNHAFVANTPWQEWIKSVWSPLLERCAGREIVLHRRSAVVGPDEEKTFRFKGESVSLGRDSDNDLSLTPRSVAAKHCRILQTEQGFVLEDLGSPLGVYLNKRKMKLNERAVIAEGDEFSIFPYRFAFRTAPVWVAETNVQSQCTKPKPLDFGAFSRGRLADAIRFIVQVYPTDQYAVLEVGRFFLEQIAQRFLRPLGLDDVAVRSYAAQAGVLEFLMLNIIEKANTSLQFPFRFSLLSDHGGATAAAEARGFEVRSTVGVSGLTGSFRAFLPHVLLNEMMSVPCTIRPRPVLPIVWRCPVTVGGTDLDFDEVRGIETGDVVLVDRRVRLTVPGNRESGWNLSEVDGNANSFRVTTYFERCDMSEINNVTDITGSIPDITCLPIRLDIVIGEREFTLREIQNLEEGTIIEVDRVIDEPVQVKLNGRAAGDGELVEIDGRLGVRILRWRNAQ